MGGEVELALQRAMHALERRDSDVANQVIENDRVIDQLELEIDRLSVEVLTLRRPVARELRMVISIFKLRRFSNASPITLRASRGALELNDEPELEKLRRTQRNGGTRARNAAIGARRFYVERFGQSQRSLSERRGSR
jgi:phosphate uptake regulator